MVFPRIQPFGSVDLPSCGKEYSRHATGSANCENSSVSFVMKYCPTSTVVRNPASVQILITRFCCDNLSTRSWYFCNRSSCAGSLVEGVGVFINKLVGTNNGSDCPASTGLPVLNMAGFVFFTQMWDCSVDTELTNRSNCAKNRFNRSPHRHRSVLTIFHLLCFWAFLGTMDSWHGKLGVRFLIINSATLSHSPCGLLPWVKYHFFSDPSPRNDHLPGVNLLA